MEKLTEVVIALLMIVNGEIKEHRIQESMSDCLKGKRIASRNLSNSVEYQCIKSMAETETDSLGNKHITKLILEQMARKFKDHVSHEPIFHKTSIGRFPSKQKMNKHKLA